MGVRVHGGNLSTPHPKASTNPKPGDNLFGHQPPDQRQRGRPLVGTPDPEHPAALGAVVLGDQLLVLEAAPDGDVDPGPGVVGQQVDQAADLDRGDRPGQADHRDRAGQAQAVDGGGGGGGHRPSAARSTAWVSRSVISRRSATAAGSTSSSRSTSASVASCRNDTRTEPWVMAPMAASTWEGSWVSAVHEDPEWTAMPSPSSSSSSASPSM